MNWYDEAARHQSELRQEAANERAIPRTGSITVVLDWFRRLFNDHHAPQPLVESRGRDVAHHHAGQSHMERFHPRLWLVQGVGQGKADHHTGLVDRHQERCAGEDELLA